MLFAQSCPSLCDPRDLLIASLAPLSMKFSRQEYWSGIAIPFSRGILLESRSALQVDSLSSELLWKQLSYGTPDPSVLFILHVQTTDLWIQGSLFSKPIFWQGLLMFLSLQLSLISIIIEQQDPCKVYGLEGGILEHYMGL